MQVGLDREPYRYTCQFKAAESQMEYPVVDVMQDKLIDIDERETMR